MACMGGGGGGGGGPWRVPGVKGVQQLLFISNCCIFICAFWHDPDS